MRKMQEMFEGFVDCSIQVNHDFFVAVHSGVDESKIRVFGAIIDDEKKNVRVSYDVVDGIWIPEVKPDYMSLSEEEYLKRFEKNEEIILGIFDEIKKNFEKIKV